MKSFVGISTCLLGLVFACPEMVDAQSRGRDQLHYRLVRFPDGHQELMLVNGDPRVPHLTVNVGSNGAVASAVSTSADASGISLATLLSGGQIVSGLLNNSSPTPTSNLNSKLEDMAIRMLERWLVKEFNLPNVDCNQSPVPSAPASPSGGSAPAGGGAAKNTPIDELDATASAASLQTRAAALSNAQRDLQTVIQHKQWEDYYQALANGQKQHKEARLRGMSPAAAAAAGVNLKPIRSQEEILKDIDDVMQQIDKLKSPAPAAPAAEPAPQAKNK